MSGIDFFCCIEMLKKWDKKQKVSIYLGKLVYNETNKLKTRCFMAEVTSRRLLYDLNDYFKHFSDGVQPDPDKERIARTYYRHVDGKDEFAQFAQLEGNQNRIDTAVEWLLASYYSVNVRNIRPPEADAILPANNPKLADKKLGAAVMQDLQILRFLGNTAAVGRYEGILKFITDRGNVTRAEVEKYYRDGIRAHISEIIEEQFNKISFFIENIIGSVAKSYNGVLTRDPKNGQYKLSYEDAKDVTKELTAASLEALLASLSRSGEFSQAAIDTVKAQAALIPAVSYPASVRNDAINIITAFCLNPNRDTFNAMTVQYRKFLLNDADKGRAAASSFSSVVSELSIALSGRMVSL